MASSDPGQLGTLIRRLRLASGLSQEQLAERSGLSARAVSDLERGQRTRTRPETLRMLAEALGLTDAEREALLQAARPELKHNAGHSTFVHPPPNALPVPRTALVGREREVVQVLTSLTGKRRPVTLTGPGGVGKTRVAIEAARRLVQDRGEPAVFVDLSPIRHPVQVAPVIAQALGIQESGESSIEETLQLALRQRRLLLILDNFEQVIDAAPLVGELIADASDLRVLVTSREGLRIGDEDEIAVEPLDLPSEAEPTDLDRLSGAAAIALFVAHAKAAKAEFELTAENAEAVVAICRRLEGLPLALELAASRVRYFPPAVLLERLERRLPVLTGGLRDSPARQRTLRDTISWSYELLTPDEQALFRRVGSFPGGASLAALDVYSTVAGALGLDLLSGLASLVDKHLVRERMGVGNTPRFSMLETIREFAGEMIVQAGEEEVSRSAILVWALEFASSGRSDVFGMLEGPDAYRKFDEEIDNLRLGFEIAADRTDAEACAKLFVDINSYLYLRGLFREAFALGERVLALAESSPIPNLLRGRVLSEFSTFWNTLYDAAGAERFARDGLALVRESTNNAIDIVGALSLLVMTIRDQGRYADALDYAEQANALAGDDDAEPFLALTRFAIGRLSYMTGDQNRAVDYLNEALCRCLVYGTNFLAFHSANYLAAAQTRRGDLAEAAATLRIAVSLWEESDLIGASGFLDEAAALAAASGRLDIAAELFGADAAQSALFGTREDYDRWKRETYEALRKKLGNAAFERATLEGRNLSMEEATALVLELVEEIEAGDGRAG